MNITIIFINLFIHVKIFEIWTYYIEVFTFRYRQCMTENMNPLNELEIK